MNILIFCLTILACWGIIRIALKAWNKADINEKMEELTEVEKNYDSIVDFKKTHKGNFVKKQDSINKFTKE